MIYEVLQFLCCKYSYNGQVQATSMMSLKIELRRDCERIAHNGLSQADTAQPQHTTGSTWLQAHPVSIFKTANDVVPLCKEF